MKDRGPAGGRACRAPCGPSAAAERFARGVMRTRSLLGWLETRLAEITPNYLQIAEELLFLKLI